jgi:hypothetical protein
VIAKTSFEFAQVDWKTERQGCRGRADHVDLGAFFRGDLI